MPTRRDIRHHCVVYDKVIFTYAKSRRSGILLYQTNICNFTMIVNVNDHVTSSQLNPNSKVKFQLAMTLDFLHTLQLPSPSTPWSVPSPTTADVALPIRWDPLLHAVGYPLFVLRSGPIRNIAGVQKEQKNLHLPILTVRHSFLSSDSCNLVQS